MSNLLLSESPLVLLPSLAIALGSAEKAIICQQLYYLMGRSEQLVDGKKWITLTVERSDQCKSWAEILPWVKSDRTLRSYLNDLITLGVLEKRQINRSRLDKTLSWTLNTAKLAEIAAAPSDDSVIPSGKSYRMGGNAETAEESQNADPVKITASIRQKLPDINTESNKEVRSNLSFNTRINTISPNGDIASADHQQRNDNEILVGEIILDTPLTQDSDAADPSKSFTASPTDKRDPDVETVLRIITEKTRFEPEGISQKMIRIFAKHLAKKLLRNHPDIPLEDSLRLVLNSAEYLADQHNKLWHWSRAGSPQYLYRHCETIVREAMLHAGRTTSPIPTL